MAASELLGLDPCSIAHEGKLFAILPYSQAEAVLTAMKKNLWTGLHPHRRGENRKSGQGDHENGHWGQTPDEYAGRESTPPNLLKSQKAISMLSGQ